jgi:hypothetical protein
MSWRRPRAFALRLHVSAAPPRGGLTQALGGRKAFGGFAFQCSLPWLRLALLFGQVLGTLVLRPSSSGALTHRIRCVGRLRKHLFTWSAFPRLTQSLRLHLAESSGVRVRAFPLLFSASMWGLGAYQHPPPPNNSFKPTPHRGVNSVLYATLHAVATPPRGGLTQALGQEDMSTLNLWRASIVSAILAVTLLPLCSFLDRLPFIDHAPIEINRFLVSWWWLALLVVIIALQILWFALILSDRHSSLTARAIWCVASFGGPAAPILYWLLVVEHRQYRFRHAST